MVRRSVALLAAAITIVASPSLHLSAQALPPTDPLHSPFDDLLDLYVRDGLVYYQALRADRGKLDRYLASLDAPEVVAASEGWNQNQRAAFWLNAYNALVLRTVIDHYPIRGLASEYPSSSIRQIPGAFERVPHRAAGRSVTLDAIEKMVLAEFHDPRLYLALGRGAIGSPRLRSEAFTGDRLEAQLTHVATECPTRSECILINPTANQISVTPVVGWHETEFIAAYATPDIGFPSRSPIERAVLAFIQPHLLTTERNFLDKDGFRVAYNGFDWTLNDLTRRTR